MPSIIDAARVRAGNTSPAYKPSTQVVPTQPWGMPAAPTAPRTPIQPTPAAPTPPPPSEQSGGEPAPNWWDLPAHIGNIAGDVSSFVGDHGGGWIADHGGSGVKDWYDNFGGDSAIGKTLAVITAPITVPVHVYTKGLELLGDATAFVSRVGSTVYQAATLDNPLYRDGVSLNDFGTMWDASQEITLGRAYATAFSAPVRLAQVAAGQDPTKPADYSARAPIFDVGFDPYHMTDAEKETLNSNPWYGVGTGALDLGGQALLAVAGNKGAGVLTRATGLATGIKGANDLRKLDTEIGDHLTGIRPTPAGKMVEDLAATTDVNKIMSNPMVNMQSPNSNTIVQMLTKVSNPEDVRLIVLADRGDRMAIAKLMSSSPDYVFQMSNMSSRLAADIASGAPTLLTPSTEKFVQSAFKSLAERDSFYKQARDAFLVSGENGDWAGMTVNNATVPRGVLGGRFMGMPGDIVAGAGRATAPVGRKIMEGSLGQVWSESDNWSQRVLGQIGSSEPVTKMLQWVGGRKPMGLVGLSATRPNEVIDEMKAYVDSAPWTRGSGTFEIRRGGQTIPMTGPQYRTEMTARLSQAVAAGPSQVAATVREIEAELTSSIALKRGRSGEEVDLFAKALQTKRDGDASDIQNRGYYLDESGHMVMPDPLYVRQLADNIHLIPLHDVDLSMGTHLEKVGHYVDTGYEAVQKLWRTGILFKPAYTLKNSVMEPLVASVLAHGSIFGPDGLYATTTHVMTNMGNRMTQFGLAVTDHGTAALSHVPLIRKTVEDTFGARAVQVGNLSKDRLAMTQYLEGLDAEVEAINLGQKSPAWRAQFEDQVRNDHAAAQQALQNITDDLDTFHIDYGMPSHHDVYEPPSYPDMVKQHDLLDRVLREDPDVAEARLRSRAEEINQAAIARGAAAAERQNQALNEARHGLEVTASNVTRVQRKATEAYAGVLTDRLLERKAALARYEARAARPGALSPDTGGYQGGMQNLHARWPVADVAGEGIIPTTKREIADLERQIAEATAHYDRLGDPTYVGSTAQRAYLDALHTDSHTVSPAPAYLAHEQEQIDLLHTQAQQIRTMTPEERDAALAGLAEARSHLDSMRDALNSPGLNTYGSRAQAEARLAEVEQALQKQTVAIGAKMQDREKYRTRVLGGTAPVVYDRGMDGTTLTKLQYTRRREANKIGAQWKANEAARVEGRHADIVPIPENYVVTPGLFDPAVFGEAYRQEFGAAMTNRATFDPRGYGDRTAGKIARGGGATAIDRYDPHYWDELTHITNRQIRQDASAQQILEGKSLPQMLQWLTTPEGVQYAEKMGWDSHNARNMVNEQFRVIHDYLPPTAQIPKDMLASLKREGHDLSEGATIQDLAALKEVTPGELRQILGEQEVLSPIHSGELGFQGAAPVKGMLDRIWHTLATQPEERVGRFPGGQRYFERHLQRDLELVKQQGGTLTPEQINGLRAGAAARALADVEKTYYNIRRYSNPVYAMRYMTAFPGALYNSMFRVAHLAAMNPGTGSWMADKFTNGFAQIGVDSNGKKTDDFTKVTAIVFDVPNYAKAAFPPHERLQIGLQSLDFVRPSPSFSWTIAVPVNSLLADRPQAADWIKKNTGQDFQNMLWPFGDPTSKAKFAIPVPGGHLVLDDMVPSHIRDFMTMIQKDGDTRYIQTTNQYLQALMYDWEQGGRKGAVPTLDDAKAAATQHWDMEFAAKFAVFGGLSMKPAGDLQRNDWQNIEAAHPGDYQGAVKEFTDKYGAGSIWFTKSTTGRAGGVPPTLDGWTALQDNKELVADIMSIDPTDPKVLAPLFGGSTDGFDQAVYNAETHTTIPGSSIVIGAGVDSATWKKQAEASISWADYMKARAVRDATMAQYGYKSIQSKDAAWLKDKWNAWMSEFAADPNNGAWLTEYQQRDFGVATRTIRALDKIVGNKDFMQKHGQEPYFQAMNTYIEQYATAALAYEKTTTAAERSDLIDKWGNYVATEILPINKEFATVYGRYLDGNDLKRVA